MKKIKLRGMERGAFESNLEKFVGEDFHSIVDSNIDGILHSVLIYKNKGEIKSVVVAQYCMIIDCTLSMDSNGITRENLIINK